ncbi:hypothetical protein [Spiroplasma endosymbiont of Acasis viretata]
MRKIMKEHNIQGLKQTKNNYPKNKKNPNKWIPTMDKVNKDYKSTTSSNQIWRLLCNLCIFVLQSTSLD